MPDTKVTQNIPWTQHAGQFQQSAQSLANQVMATYTTLEGIKQQRRQQSVQTLNTLVQIRDMFGANERIDAAINKAGQGLGLTDIIPEGTGGPVPYQVAQAGDAPPPYPDLRGMDRFQREQAEAQYNAALAEWKIQLQQRYKAPTEFERKMNIARQLVGEGAGLEEVTAKYKELFGRMSPEEFGMRAMIGAQARETVAQESPMSVGDISKLRNPETFEPPPFGMTKKAAIEAGFVPVSQKQVDELMEFDKTREILDKITTYADRLITAKTPLEALAQRGLLSMGARTKTNEDAAVYRDEAKAYLGVLARSMGGERGVLTNQDIERVAVSLPQFGDTYGIKNKKIQLLDDLWRVGRNAKRKSILGQPIDKEKAEAKKLVDEIKAVDEASQKMAGTEELPPEVSGLLNNLDTEE